MKIRQLVVRSIRIQSPPVTCESALRRAFFEGPDSFSGTYYVETLYKTDTSLRVGSHDPFLGPIIYLALFQPIEILIRVINFFEFEQ